jgi:hypothetical protein
MPLEHRVAKLETALSPQRWIYTTSWYEACEEKQTALQRIHDRWSVNNHDLIIVYLVEALGGCRLKGTSHSHADAEVSRMPHR